MRKRFFLVISLTLLTIVSYAQPRNLDFFISKAIQNSPLINEYRNQISSAVSDSLLILAARKPFVEARSLLQYSPFYRNFGYDDVITDGGNYSAVMGITQPLLNRKEIKNKFESIEVQKLSLNNSTRISINELKKYVTNQYLTAYSGYKDLQFNRSFLELFKKEDAIVKQFVENGIARQTDYLSLMVETQSQEILVSQIYSQYRKDLMLLSQICGLIDTAFYELSYPDLNIIGTPDIAKSPAYIQYKIDSTRIETEKNAIDLKYMPKINWFADAGFLTSNPWNFYRHFGYSAGLSLNFPVYDGKQKEIEKKKFEYSENSRKFYESTYYNQYFQQIHQLTIELESLNSIYGQLEKQLITSGQLVNVLKDQLEAGIIQMTEYVSAIKNFKTTTRNINLINVQKLQIINEMNFLLTQ
jgi:outer membrane protein TolC